MVRTTARFGALAAVLLSSAGWAEEAQTISKSIRIASIDIDPPTMVVVPAQQITPCTEMVIDPEHFRKRGQVTAGQLLIAPIVNLVLDAASRGAPVTLHYSVGAEGTCRITRAGAAY